MKKSNPIGIEIKGKESLNLRRVTIDDENLKKLDSIALIKFQLSDIQKYFLDLKLFNKYYKALHDLISRCIPDEVAKSCKYHNGESDDEMDNTCAPYVLQMETTFLMGAGSFNKIIEANSHIIHEKELIQELARCFFKCFYGVKAKGMIYFDSDAFIKYSLSFGFVSLSKSFKENNILNSLRLINNTIDEIETFQLTKNIPTKKSIPYPKVQKKFFKQKQKHLEKKLELEGYESQKLNNTHNRPNRTDIALFAYYSSNSKELKLDTTFPSEAAFKELEKKHNKNWKNIQLMYNQIIEPNHRLKRVRVNNIEYVIKNMLEDYPRAKNEATKELKIAKSKS